MIKKYYKFLVFPFCMEKDEQNANKKNYEFLELRLWEN